MLLAKYLVIICVISFVAVLLFIVPRIVLLLLILSPLSVGNILFSLASSFIFDHD